MRTPAGDHQPLKQDEFRGLYSRGVSDSTPPDFFLDSQNVKFGEGEVLTREGCSLNITKSGVRRFFVYKRLGETPRFIILDSNGNLFDSLAPGVPIYTDASFVDFSMINYANRAYITPHNRIKGISGKSLLVYEGSGSARLAAGPAPTGFSLIVANSGLAGSVEAGVHIIAVANITSSGFISAPGPEIFTTVLATGGRKLDVSSINVGPSGTVARVLLATKSIPLSLFTGNQYGYELFFVPDGTINDNTTTTATIDFYDADLVSSADYLIDNLATIPAGLGLIVYQGRLGLWGEDSHQFTLRLSTVGQPEVFSGVSGFINLDPSDAVSGIKNCAEYRKSLIICTQNRIYTSADNGSDPNTWVVDVVDKSAGTECFGIATVLDARGSNTDRIWIADRSGLIAYEGYAKRPELSWNIEDIWKRINKAVFNLVQVADDPVNHRIFITLPLDSSAVVSHMLMADYSKAFTPYGTLDEKQMKWTFWAFPSPAVSIAADLDSVTSYPVLHVALTAGNIYTVKSTLTDDFGNAIDSYVQLALKNVLAGWIHHFGCLKFRVTGTGNMNVLLTGEDGSLPTSVGSIPLSSAPGGEPEKLINFTNEKMSVKLRTSLFGERFVLSQIITYLKPMWAKRPG